MTDYGQGSLFGKCGEALHHSLLASTRHLQMHCCLRRQGMANYSKGVTLCQGGSGPTPFTVCKALQVQETPNALQPK